MTKRYEKIEILRVIAMAAVVMNHVNIVALHIFDTSDAVNIAFISQVLQCLSLFAVPCFFLISGYLMLADTYHYSLKKLIQKSIAKYLMVIFVYGTGFAWIELIFNDRSISLKQLPKAIYAMVIGGSWDHLWFLYAYLGLLLVYPILKIFWDHADNTSKKFVLLAGFLLTSVAPLLRIGIRFPISNAYVFCFLAGGYLHTLEEKKVYPKKRYLVIALAVGAVTVIVLTYFYYFYSSTICDKLLTDSSIPTLLIAFSLSALLILNNNTKSAGPRLLAISANSFGVYIYHMFWLNILYKVIRLNPYQYGGVLGMLVCIVLSLLGTIAISIITTIITKKIPLLGKLL